MSRLEQFFSREQKTNLHRNRASHFPFSARRAASGSTGGVKPGPAKPEAVRRLPQPTDKQAVRQFLDIGRFYWRIIHNYARVVHPLQQLIPDAAVFVRGEEQANGFAAIKRRCLRLPRCLILA